MRSLHLRALLITMCASPGLIAGCHAPSARLTFPPAPLEWTSEHRLYDVDGNGTVAPAFFS